MVNTPFTWPIILTQYVPSCTFSSCAKIGCFGAFVEKRLQNQELAAPAVQWSSGEERDASKDLSDIKRQYFVGNKIPA